MQTINLYKAIETMRKYSAVNIPFSFEFESYNRTKGTSEGHKVEEKALLRKGLRNDRSDVARYLIAYTNRDGEPRFFHIALLKKFNNLKVIP